VQDLPAAHKQERLVYQDCKKNYLKRSEWRRLPAIPSMFLMMPCFCIIIFLSSEEIKGTKVILKLGILLIPIDATAIVIVK